MQPRWAQVLLIAGLLLALAAGSLALVHQARAATYDVCPSGCAYTSINAALAPAASGATIKVGPGTYGPGTSDVPISISKPVNLVVPYPTRGDAGKRAAGSYYTPSLFAPRTRRLVRLLARLG